jgi:hypothetical protein
MPEENKRGRWPSNSTAQKSGPASLSETFRAKKKTSTPVSSDRTTDKGGSDKKTKTSNKRIHFHRTQMVCTKFPVKDMKKGWHLGTHHTSTGICYLGKIVQGITYERFWVYYLLPTRCMSCLRCCCQGTLMSTKRTLMSLGCGESPETVPWLSCIWRRDRASLFFLLENRMMISRKKLGTRPWKTHWSHQSIPNCRLVMTKESSPMMMTHTGNTSTLRWQEGAW